MKRKLTGNESVVVFFFTLRDLFRSSYFFSQPPLKELIKNKLCKSSFVLSPVFVCQFALSAVGCFKCPLFCHWFSAGISASCQSTSALCLALRFVSWQMVGLSGVTHLVAASWPFCPSRVLFAARRQVGQLLISFC